MSGDALRRILAVDFGDRRTGLAATDWTGTIVVPLAPIVGRDDRGQVAAILEVAAERDSQVLVVGVPYARDGGIGRRAQRTLEFVAALRAAAGSLPVETVDEAQSTDEAHERLKSLG